MHRLLGYHSSVVILALLSVTWVGCGKSETTAPAASISTPAADTSDDAPNDEPAKQDKSPAIIKSRYSTNQTEVSTSQTNDVPRYPSFAKQDAAVRIKTSVGEIVVKLNADKAPRTVENFLRNYVTSSFYEGTIVHYADDGLIAAGGFHRDLSDKPTHQPIRNEAENGLSNRRGTIAMGRSPDVIDSATAQFFINVVDNAGLDHKGPSPEEFGYCVFGEVIEGMEIVDKIANVATHDVDDLPNVPVEPIVIESITVER